MCTSREGTSQLVTPGRQYQGGWYSDLLTWEHWCPDAKRNAEDLGAEIEGNTSLFPASINSILIVC
jgi:hypothetical protein